MGYYMNLEDQEFLIKKENMAGALAAIKAIAPHKDRARNYFSWVNTKKYQAAETLEDALMAWRWPPYMNKNANPKGEIVSLEFDGEKSGDEEALFRAIAPFVESGSFIEKRGEDGERWRWRFHKGDLYEIYPEIVWPKPS